MSVRLQRRRDSPPFDRSIAVEDTRVADYEPLIAPNMIEMENPLSDISKETVVRGRRHARNILNGEDDRLLVIVGPCSIHDVEAAVEYANRLKALAEQHKDILAIIMRTYFEKPRTTVGWKGLINDPFMDGSFRINQGICIARQLLNEITHLGVPVGFELLDTISPQYFSDLVSWGAIGARTTECQLHRELVSGVSFPVGFKNGTDGGVGVALDAIQAAAHPHHFLGVTKQGITSIVHTSGNDTCHVILRGGKNGPNFKESHVREVTSQLEARGERARVMVDASHGNSNKDHKNQLLVIEDIAGQVEGGSTSVFGVMIESNIHEGSQTVSSSGPKGLKYGVSITDACVGWETTVDMMDILSKAVIARRAKLAVV
ncbi:3-deoxy-7-phosphoheptulonate synthase [Chytriomyces hyalinus]|nr:3-deoxy-7-phosphoheptulonate synthase [Chytriomyces hyalinus]